MPAMEEREKIDAFWFRLQFLGVGHEKEHSERPTWSLQHRKKTVKQ